MNKTIIININGIVFHIEEEAYEVLRTYMTDIKRHFAYSADSEEIVTDIENRLAEMFNERLSKHNKQVIEVLDVSEIIHQMGSVNDFADLDEETNPTSTSFSRIEKRLYRDAEEKNIAGVCAGLAHYFDIEVKWVRLTAILSIFLSGSGILAYVILWMVVPEAKTRQEKMAMRGEQINLQNFKKNFDDELESFKQNFSAKNFQKASDSTGKVLNSLVDAIVRIVKVLIKIIGGFVILAGVMALLALISGLIFSLGFWNNEEMNMLPFSAINPEYRSAVYFSIFLLLVVPLIALISFAVRVIFNRGFISRTGSFAMLVLWLTGLGMGIYYGSKIASEFKEDARVEQRNELNKFPVYYLKLNHKRLLTRGDSLNLNINQNNFKGNILIDEDNDFDNLTKFDLFIEKSEDNKVELIKEFKSQGKTFQKALKNAQNTTYQFLQKDSVLYFDKYIYLTENTLFRDQRVAVTLKIPVNTQLVIEGEFDSHLNHHHLWDCKPEGSKYHTISEWIMTNDGLKCKIDSLNNREKE